MIRFTFLIFLFSFSGAFPNDAGYINVRSFGAVGDGLHDDTSAINAAITALPDFDKRFPFSVKPLYFPSGTYLVHDTIQRVDMSGFYQSSMTLVGDGAEKTKIILAPHSDLYNDQTHTRPVIRFSSGWLAGPNSMGGKNPRPTGVGNDGFQNNLQDLSVVIGAGNPGAVAIEYLANNIGSIRSVRITCPSMNCAKAVDMTKRWIGPAFLGDVHIDGFKTGIDVANTEYGVTFKNITIKDSTEYGIVNNSNVISMSSIFVSCKSGVGIANLSLNGLIVARDTRVFGECIDSFSNYGFANLKNVRLSHAKLSNSANSDVFDGVFRINSLVGHSGWRLQSAPHISVSKPPDDSIYWINRNDGDDITDDISKALLSGRRYIIIRNGNYRVTRTIDVPEGGVVIDASFSTITADISNNVDGIPAIFNIGAQSSSVTFRRLNLGSFRGAPIVAFHLSGRASLHLFDIWAGGMRTIDRLNSGGEIYGENVFGGAFEFRGDKNIWLLQLNTEGRGVRIKNGGSPLFIMGIKTEQNMTLIQNEMGGDVEIFGGLVYKVVRDATQIPYLINNKGRIIGSFVEEALRPDAVYQTFLRSLVDGIYIDAGRDMFPGRNNFGKMVSSISSVTDIVIGRPINGLQK